jgi:hypothetical protein
MDALSFPREYYIPGARQWSQLGRSKQPAADSQLLRLDVKLTPIQELENFKSLKGVSIGHASQSDIEYIAALSALTCVCLVVPQFSSLAPLGALRQLTTLELDDPPSLTGLESLGGLECLVLRHFRRVKNLSAVASLSALRAISMSTIPSWDASHRCLTVESLEPLCRLERLESLSLMGVSPLDGRLDWLQQLKTLKHLHVSHVFQFQLEDYAALARALPEASGHCLLPYYALPHLPLRCKRCCGDVVFITGPRPRARHQLCPICDERKLQAHEGQWNAALRSD